MLIRRFYALIFFSLVFVVINASSAWADLTLTPQRIVINPNERSATLAVMNQSNSIKSYNLEWVHTRMDENGRISPVATSAGGVSSFVTFSPRRVTLRPGESQTIRIAVRRPPGLPNGEYRSHLQLNSVDLSPPPFLAGSPDGLGAQLSVNMGFTMPVIVRQGQSDLSASVTATAQELNLAEQYTIVRFERQGSYSTFGDVHLFWRPDGNSQLRPIGQLKSVPVYPEVATITKRIPLFPDHGADLSYGELHVYYVDPANNNAVLSQTGVSL